MTITLTFAQKAWIEARVASGEFASVEDAAHSLIDEAIAGRAIEDDDLSWAKPLLVEEALAEVERGETINAEASRTEIAAFLETLKR